MKWLENRKTAVKVMMGLAFAGLVIVTIGWLGIGNMAAVKANTENIYEVQVVIAELAEMRGVTHQIRAEVYMALAAKDAAEAKERMEQVHELTKQLTEHQEKHLPTIHAQEVRDAFTKYQQAASEYNSHLAERVLKPLRAGQRDAALVAARDAIPKFRAAIDGINSTIALSQGIGKKKFEESQALYASSRLSMAMIAVVGGGIALAVGFLFARMIAQPLNRMSEMLKDMAQGEGDLTKRLDVSSEDEVGQTAKWFNSFVDKQNEMILQLRGTADQVLTASHELSAATEQLSSGAQQQASSLEETAASLEEITGTVKQNADNARQANQLAVSSRETAEKGRQVVTSAVASMAEINNSSKKIADIIATIDEIAFQTNLLALNAAVEAARAGEQGRGFAVVAAEVRNLAQRSAQAAKEIKALIQDSVQKVQTGSELVNKSGTTLEEIVTSVKRVTDIIAEIAAASQEQSTGIDQVNRAVTQMDYVVQANAAETEEMSSTAQSLAAQAAQLQSLVGRFKVKGGADLSVRVPASHPTKTVVAKPVVKAAPKERVIEAALAGAHAVKGSARGKDDGFEEF